METAGIATGGVESLTKIVEFWHLFAIDRYGDDIRGQIIPKAECFEHVWADGEVAIVC